jgi:hypothetical protein
LDFCIEWFDSNTKENFKVYLEIALENFEKKKKTFSSSFLASGPSAQLPLASPHLLLDGPLGLSRADGQHAHPVLAFLLALLSWAEPAACPLSLACGRVNLSSPTPRALAFLLPLSQ